MTDKKSTYFIGYNISNDGQKGSMLSRLTNIYKKEGLVSLVKKLVGYTKHRIRYKMYRMEYNIYRLNYYLFNRFFNLDGRKFHYFINIYNAVKNERVIEIPFAKEYILKNEDKSILEVGNVLSHYFNVNYDIIDKYEINPLVTNVDITDFSTEKKYDLIISVSTIEHVGLDEEDKEGGKSKKALLKIIELLNNNGTAIITVPLGYNPEIDSIVMNNEINFTKKYFLKRVSILNLWKEITMHEALKHKYGLKYPAANSVAFLIYKKSEK